MQLTSRQTTLNSVESTKRLLPAQERNKCQLVHVLL
ncbi:hypothetical protein FOTG_19124 [Fusarium oxysporum f. sp. vasinfectum 25433]|uniref:Uncharacterized protein n=1 Tax=Fusarium oxysporum f. sp. vasinfectum 25433 TaxID=1089449 RepID=X0KUN2_FUSOX|nr:hypothetical protein FOTG_19124 [Fusarium oxysporum f. sp. vasinfectum 25433]